MCPNPSPSQLGAAAAEAVDRRQHNSFVGVQANQIGQKLGWHKAVLRTRNFMAKFTRAYTTAHNPRQLDNFSGKLTVQLGPEKQSSAAVILEVQQ